MTSEMILCCLYDDDLFDHFDQDLDNLVDLHGNASPDIWHLVRVASFKSI